MMTEKKDIHQGSTALRFSLNLGLATIAALLLFMFPAVAQDFPELDFDEETRNLRDLFGGSNNDFSHRFLAEIFGPIFEFQGDPGRTNVFVIIIGYFNIFALILGLVLFFYNVAAGVLQSAHEGQVLGRRWNSLWAPIRVVLAVGLLAPLPGMGGYNAVQGGIAYLVKGSTGVASYIWVQAANGIFANGVSIAGGVARIDPAIVEASYNMNVCMNVINHQMVNAGDPRRVIMGELDDIYPAQNIPGPSNFGAGDYTHNVGVAAGVTYFGKSVSTVVSNSGVNTHPGICGSISVPAPPRYITNIEDAGVRSTNIARYQDAHLESVNTINSAMSAVVTANFEEILAGRNVPVYDLRAAITASMDESVKTLNNRIEAIVAELSGSRNPDGTGFDAARQRIMDQISGGEDCAAGISADCHGEGWIGAGSWYMLIARVNNEVMSLYSGMASVGTQRYESLDFYNQNSIAKLWAGVRGRERQQDINLNEANRITEKYQEAFATSTAGLSSYGFSLDTSIAAQARPGESSFEWTWLREKFTNFTSTVVGWLSDPMRNHDDPIVGITNIGNSMINWGFGVMAADVALNFGAARRVGDVLSGGAISRISGVLSALAGVLIAVGGIMAFIIPMLPFLIWVLAVTGYFLLVAEAIVAASIWAIAHLRMDGEGISGDSARQGYLMVLSLLLTPVLMIFGFIVGMAIFRVTSQLVGAGYGYAIAGIVGSNPLAGMIGLVTLTILQVLIYLVLIERSFSLISEFPQRVLAWIGGSAQLTKGEEDRVRVAAVGAGYGMTKFSQGLSTGGDTAAAKGGEALNRRGSAGGGG